MKQVLGGGRAAVLEVVLDAAAGPDADTRNKACRLVANRLWGEARRRREGFYDEA